MPLVQPTRGGKGIRVRHDGLLQMTSDVLHGVDVDSIAFARANSGLCLLGTERLPQIIALRYPLFSRDPDGLQILKRLHLTREDMEGNGAKSGSVGALVMNTDHIALGP